MGVEQGVPVWVWLEQESDPVCAGYYSLEAGVGRFWYEHAYLKRTGAYALDPQLLPLASRSSGRGYVTRLNAGLFGVFKDVCPEGYGRDLLLRKYAEQADDLSVLQLLEYAEGDGVGAVEVCENIARKAGYRAVEAEVLFSVLARLAPERHDSHAIHQVLSVGTSMGGERPKLTVQYEGDMWLAKLQDRGDQPYMPAREHVAMSLARACGIRAAETLLHRAENGREVLLVRRFDRVRSGLLRRAYLSAHTLLRLDGHVLPGDRARSYLALADAARRLGVPQSDVVELWRRMVFNALVYNIDDHPRNHGFVRESGGWRLAPAFDVVPLLPAVGAEAVLLAMAVAADGSRRADVDALLISASHFGVGLDAAADWLQGASENIAMMWREQMLAAGVSEVFCEERQRFGFALAERLARDKCLIDVAVRAVMAGGGRRRRLSPTAGALTPASR